MTNGKMKFVFFTNCSVLLYLMWRMLANNQFVADLVKTWGQKVNVVLDSVSTSNLRDVIIIAVVVSVLGAVLYRLWHLVFGAISLICIALVASFIYDWYTVGQTTDSILLFILLVISFVNCSILSSK